MARRRLQVTTPDYALYANNPDTAVALGRWFDNELSTVRARYPVRFTPCLIFAIEPDGEPDPLLDAWRATQVIRSRQIDWHSDRWKQPSFRSKAGRPYCLGYGCPVYFIESFSIPDSALLRLDLKPETWPTTAGVCALTTDTHLLAEFDREWARRQARAREEREAKGKRGVGEAIVEGLWNSTRDLLAADYRCRDLELMRLQRKEVLWRTLLTHVSSPVLDHTQAVAVLRDETDEAWKRLYFARPIE